ncbi:MAG: AI-2E family transporter [Eubacterium sp.]|nr:AI-2E family transporter [Eubacterium sp.]
MKLPNGTENHDRKFWLRFTWSLCVAAAVFTALWHISDVWGAVKAFFGFFSTVVIGVVIAYVLDPLVTWFDRTLYKKMKRRGISRNLSIITTLLVVLLLTVIMLVALIPQVVKSVVNFVKNIDIYAESLQKMVAAITAASGNDSQFNLDLSGLVSYGDSVLSTITGYITDHSSSIINATINVGSGFVSILIAVFIAVYVLVEKETMKDGLDRFVRLAFSPDHYENVKKFWSRCNRILIRFIVFDLLDGLFVGCVNAVFMLIAGYPYVVLVSVVVGLANLAPTFGPMAGGIIGAFILLMVNPWYALGFIIFTVALQTFDGYIFKPKVFGNTFGVSSLMILVSIVVFGKMFGVIGILLAIPLAAIIDYVYKEWLLPELKKRRQAADAAPSDSDS